MLDYHNEVFDSPVSSRVSRKSRRQNKRNYKNIIKVRDVIRLVESDGWVFDRQKGSHRQYKHVIKRGVVTIPGHKRSDIHPKTLNSILNQSGLKR